VAARARRLGAEHHEGGTPVATLRDVARDAGVSIASASHALNGTKPVSDELRRRVQAAAARVGYVPHAQARSLRTGRSRTIGVLLPDLGNPFFPALLQAVCTAANDAGYGTLVADAGDTEAGERAALELLAAQRVDGVVWAPRDVPGAPPDLPTVTVDRSAEGCDGVASDHRGSGRLQARHLRAAGRTRPVVLNGPSRVPSARERAAGFRDGWDGAIAFEAEVPFDHRLPAEVRAALVAGDADFDAVVCANDAIAFGVLRLLHRCGRRVPEDVAVIGVDDIAFAELAEPALTTVRQPLSELGREAVRLLIERIDGREGSPRRVMLPVELIVRGSSPELVPASSEGRAR
jgi:LacI family transcriptional regulator